MGLACLYTGLYRDRIDMETNMGERKNWRGKDKERGGREAGRDGGHRRAMEVKSAMRLLTLLWMPELKKMRNRDGSPLFWPHGCCGIDSQFLTIWKPRWLSDFLSTTFPSVWSSSFPLALSLFLYIYFFLQRRMEPQRHRWPLGSFGGPLSATSGLSLSFSLPISLLLFPFFSLNFCLHSLNVQTVLVDYQYSSGCPKLPSSGWFCILCLRHANIISTIR